jgi:thermostable 8-oxoguanine DNA glycosylase
MPVSQVTKAIDWKGNPSIVEFLSNFSVYPELTEKLDAADLEFSENVVHEIVLWKLGRYVKIPPSTLADLGNLKSLKHGEHREAANVLEQLLSCNGVRLPMASTFLRFANPSVFQIYDRHICRALTGNFSAVAPKDPSKSLRLYWSFLDELANLCINMKIPFKDSDRILFEFDKQINPPLSGNKG